MSGRTVSITTANGTFISGTLDRVSNSSGISTFNDLSIDIPGTGYALSASSSGCTTITSAPFDILEPPTTLTFLQQPTSTTAGVTITPSLQVEVLDQYSSPVSSVAVSCTTTNGTFITGTLTRFSNSSGIATFDNLSITITGNYVLSATAGTISTTSNAFSITAATPNTLTFTQQPTETTAGVNITPSVTVEVKDVYGNLVPVTSVVMTSNAVQLNGTLSQNTNSSGVATFGNLNITTTGSYVLTATATAVIQGSTGFNIIPAASDNLVFIQQPTDTISGAQFSPVITVRIRDGYNNTVSNATDGVSLTVSAGSTLTSSFTNIPPSAGVVTFTGVGITG
ncbi:MAG: hemagglutinin, partial [Planctomycetota bacterium]|nr:hemagglutinin [Planctomycetota bacterium]